MLLSQLVTNRFHEWAKDYDVRNVMRLDKRLVHRYETNNVFVSRIQPSPDRREDEFIGQFAFDPDHPFFFEHALDHIPGLMLIEAARQFGTALAHLHYSVDSDHCFILDDIVVRFERFAELKLPVFAVCMVNDKVLRRQRLTGMTFAGHWIQEDQPIGYMKAAMRIYERRLYERIRRSVVETIHAAQL
jgi:hypothetical protein